MVKVTTRPDTTSPRAISWVDVPLAGRPRADWIGLLARLLLGLPLLIAGALKVGSPLASARAVQAYQLFDFDLAAYIGYALPIVEIILGILILLGLFTRLSALAGSLLMLAFMVGIASAWARGLRIDCGCFGGGGPTEDPAYLPEILRDLAFLAGGLWLLWRPRSAFSLDDTLFGRR